MYTDFVNELSVINENFSHQAMQKLFNLTIQKLLNLTEI